MKNGLKVVQLPGRYWSVTRVGWMRRVAGDEWELINACTIIRTGQSRTVASLADDGPLEDHRVSAPANGVEEVHRLVIRRSLQAADVWLKHCPKPVNWVDSE